MIGAGSYTCIRKPFDMDRVMALVAGIADRKEP